jgi:CO dehydrogenase/acetyl-CoA synthase beta subunit
MEISFKTILNFVVFTGLKVYHTLMTLENLDKLSLEELQHKKQQYDLLIKNIETIKVQFFTLCFFCKIFHKAMLCSITFYL